MLWGLIFFLQIIMLIGLVFVWRSDGSMAIVSQDDSIRTRALISEIEQGRHSLSPSEQAQLLREGQRLHQATRQSLVTVKSYFARILQTLFACVLAQVILLVRLLKKRSSPLAT